MVPYLFASSPGIHPYVFLRDLGGIEVPDRSYYDALHDPDWERPGLLEALRTSLYAAGSHYQDVIVWGDPDAADALVSRGFELDYTADSLAIGRFVGCPVQVRAAAPPSAEGLVQWGWFPLEAEAARQTTVHVSETGVDYVQADLVAPCGPTWLRLAVRDAGTTYVCSGATADGKVLLDVRPDLTFSCELTPYEAPTP